MARRQLAETLFNNLKTSLDSIKAELQKYGVDSVTEAEAELNRLQGEYRLINDFVGEVEKTTKKDVGKVAGKIDTTKVKGA